MHRTVWMLALAMACAGDKEPTDDTDTDTDTDTTPACGNSLLGSWPEDGAAAVYPGTVIDFTLVNPDDSATITVTDGAGGDVAGTTTAEGDRVVFRPDAPLTGGETYSATLDWACDPATNTFTVDTGIGDAVDLAAASGSTYLLDLRAGRFVAPTGIGDALQSLIQVNLLLQTNDDAGALALVTGVADENNEQDVCVPTVPFDQDATFDNPYWSASQDTLPLTVAGDVVTVTELQLAGAFAADGSEIVGFSLDGIIDTRDLVESVAPGGGDDAVCNLFSATFAIDCEECPGGGTFCINLVIDDLTLPAQSYQLQPVSEADVAGNPDCAEE